MLGKKMEINNVAGFEAPYFNRDLLFLKEPNSTTTSRTCSPIRMEPTSFETVVSSSDGKSTPRFMGNSYNFFQQGMLKQDAAVSETDAKMHSSLEALEQPESVVGSLCGPCVQLEQSVGSNGHPDNCRPACKYVRRKGGCRDGANCPNCHFCEWRRASHMKEQSAETTMISITKRMPPPGMCMLSVANGSPSVGSVGHPHSCKAPCKYFFKASGCKDGGACTRCHICRWTRKQERDKAQVSSSIPVPGSQCTPYPYPPGSDMCIDNAPMYVSVTDVGVEHGVHSF